jgi:hypothetical protein
LNKPLTTSHARRTARCTLYDLKHFLHRPGTNLLLFLEDSSDFH